MISQFPKDYCYFFVFFFVLAKTRGLREREAPYEDTARTAIGPEYIRHAYVTLHCRRTNAYTLFMTDRQTPENRLCDSSHRRSVGFRRTRERTRFDRNRTRSIERNTAIYEKTGLTACLHGPVTGYTHCASSVSLVDPTGFAVT